MPRAGRGDDHDSVIGAGGATSSMDPRPQEKKKGIPGIQGSLISTGILGAVCQGTFLHVREKQMPIEAFVELYVDRLAFYHGSPDQMRAFPSDYEIRITDIWEVEATPDGFEVRTKSGEVDRLVGPSKGSAEYWFEQLNELVKSQKSGADILIKGPLQMARKKGKESRFFVLYADVLDYYHMEADFEAGKSARGRMDFVDVQGVDLTSRGFVFNLGGQAVHLQTFEKEDWKAWAVALKKAFSLYGGAAAGPLQEAVEARLASDEDSEPDSNVVKVVWAGSLQVERKEKLSDRYFVLEQEDLRYFQSKDDFQKGAFQRGVMNLRDMSKVEEQTDRVYIHLREQNESRPPVALGGRPETRARFLDALEKQLKGKSCQVIRLQFTEEEETEEEEIEEETEEESKAASSPAPAAEAAAGSGAGPKQSKGKANAAAAGAGAAKAVTASASPRDGSPKAAAAPGGSASRASPTGKPKASPRESSPKTGAAGESSPKTKSRGGSPKGQQKVQTSPRDGREDLKTGPKKGMLTMDFYPDTGYAYVTKPVKFKAKNSPSDGAAPQAELENPAGVSTLVREVMDIAKTYQVKLEVMRQFRKAKMDKDYDAEHEKWRKAVAEKQADLISRTLEELGVPGRVLSTKVDDFASDPSTLVAFKFRFGRAAAHVKEAMQTKVDEICSRGRVQFDEAKATATLTTELLFQASTDSDRPAAEFAAPDVADDILGDVRDLVGAFMVHVGVTNEYQRPDEGDDEELQGWHQGMAESQARELVNILEEGGMPGTQMNVVAREQDPDSASTRAQQFSFLYSYSEQVSLEPLRPRAAPRASVQRPVDRSPTAGEPTHGGTREDAARQERLAEERPAEQQLAINQPAHVTPVYHSPKQSGKGEPAKQQSGRGEPAKQQSSPRRTSAQQRPAAQKSPTRQSSGLRSPAQQAKGQPSPRHQVSFSQRSPADGGAPMVSKLSDNMAARMSECPSVKGKFSFKSGRDNPRSSIVELLPGCVQVTATHGKLERMISTADIDDVEVLEEGFVITTRHGDLLTFLCEPGGFERRPSEEEGGELGHASLQEWISALGQACEEVQGGRGTRIASFQRSTTADDGFGSPRPGAETKKSQDGYPAGFKLSMSDAGPLSPRSPRGALDSEGSPEVEAEASPEVWGAIAAKRRASTEVGIEAKLREIFQLCDPLNKGTITMRQLAEVCRTSALTADFFHKLPPVGGVSAMEAILKDGSRRGRSEITWDAFRRVYAHRPSEPLAEGPLLFIREGQVRFVRVFEDRVEHYDDPESASTGSTPGLQIFAPHVRRFEAHCPSDFILQLMHETIELRVPTSFEDSFATWHRAFTTFCAQPEEEPSPVRKTSSKTSKRASSRPRRQQGGGGNSQFEPPPEFMQEISSSLLEDWVNSLSEPPVCHGVLGMSDKGVLVARYGVLFQDRFLAYDRPLDAVHGRRPQFNMPTGDMRSFDRIGKGFVVHFMFKNVPFHVVSEKDLEQWSRKLLGILDPQKANSFFRPIEDVTGMALGRSASLASGMRRSSSELRSSASEPRQQVSYASDRAKSSGGYVRGAGTSSRSSARCRNPANRAFFINTHNDARQAGELIHGPHMQVLTFSGRPGGDRLITGFPGKVNDRSGEQSPFIASGGSGDPEEHYKPCIGSREHHMTHTPREPVGHCLWDKVNQTTVRSFSPARTPRGDRSAQVAGKVGAETVLYKKCCHS